MYAKGGAANAGCCGVAAPCAGCAATLPVLTCVLWGSIESDWQLCCGDRCNVAPSCPASLEAGSASELLSACFMMGSSANSEARRMATTQFLRTSARHRRSFNPDLYTADGASAHAMRQASTNFGSEYCHGSSKSSVGRREYSTFVISTVRASSCRKTIR